MEERRCFSRAEGIQHHMRGSHKKGGRGRRGFLLPPGRQKPSRQEAQDHS